MVNYYDNIEEKKRNMRRNVLRNLVERGKKMRQGGIEPPAKPWKGFMLPLHH